MSSHLVQFHSTQWSLIAELDGTEADIALAQLCQQYWQPLYAFIRQRVNDEHRAQDLIQSFFVHLISKDSLRLADRERGRFRTFLLAACKNFLANESAKEAAQRRGGSRPILSLDFATAELELPQSDRHASPEKQFERAWTLRLIARVMEMLCKQFESNGRKREFEILKPSLEFVSSKSSTDEIALELGVTPENARQQVSRFRKRFRALLKGEVQRLVHDAEDIEDEIRLMFQSLAG